MKRKILFLIAAFFALKFNVSAATVTLQDAQTVALNFFNLTTGNSQSRQPLTATVQYTYTESDGIVDYYVFNMSPVKGFVIVSANDNDVPIIGYSTESTFRNDFSKVGVSDWLGRWSQEIHYVTLNNIVASPRAADRWYAYRQGVAPANEKTGSSVAPFCKTTWDQDNESGVTPALYNNYCPGTGANQCVTGCVATAMAQIMRYWNYPTKGIGSSSYADNKPNYSDNNGTLSFNYGNTTFDWANMPLNLTNSSTTTQIDAVGTLMYAAGVSVDMDYDPDGSGAFVLTAESGGGACAQKSYVNYFGYQSVIKGLLEGTGSGKIASAAFVDSIEAELNVGRLVQVQGTDTHYGGHTWVCDGYNTSDQLHMNWGWSGYSDGYFAITSLDPNDGDALDFSTDIGALTHILPPAATITEAASVGSTAICPGGTAQLTATAHANTTYSWAPTTGLTCATCATTNVTATATTVYTITVDSAGSTATASVSVNVNAAVKPSPPSTTPVACYGGSTGAITMTAPISGSGSYTYLWSSGQTTASISGLVAGTYTVTITDINHCTATAGETVSQPTSALAASVTETNATCGNANGSATVTPSGGTSGYTYKWTGGATTATLSNVAAGTYNVTITDSKTCTTTSSASISTTAGLTASLTATDAKCYGASSGSVSATVTGGTGLTYAWSNGGSTSTISNVQAGSYTVTITGAGCSTTASKTVNQPASAVSASVSGNNASCNLANGSASALGVGGTQGSGYTYIWNNTATTPSISGLGGGTYHVTVSDANLCSATAEVVLTSSAGLNTSATAANVMCYGASTGSINLTVTGNTGTITYDWSNGAHSSTLSNIAAGNYTVTVTDANGCSATMAESVSQPTAPISVSLASAGAACGTATGSITATVNGGVSGYTYNWSATGTGAVVSNLSPGNYNVTVTDNNGCSASATTAVASSGSLSLTANPVGALCNGMNNGIAAIAVANGSSPFTYAWSNGASTDSVTGLIAGSYIVTVTDKNGCSNSSTVIVTQPDPVVATTSATDCSSGQSNGSATVSTATGGTGTYTYSWSNGDNTQSINNLTAGTYQVSVTDQNGCQDVTSAIVGVTTGVNDLANAISFNMYPNPASSDVIISVNKAGAETTLSLKNILGQQLIFKVVTDAQTHVDVSTLANGVYLIELRQADKKAVRQLIVNK